MDDDIVWQKVINNDCKGYIRIDERPQRHLDEAKLRVKEIIVDTLSKDRNAYHLHYIKECGISPDDLRGKIKDSKGRVCDEVLLGWNKRQVVSPVSSIPWNIPTGNIELYFWGAHGSGKTCAIESILSGFKVDDDCPVTSLPTPSPVDSLLYRQVTIHINEGKRTEEKKLSIVEVPGCIFECFECEMYGVPFKTEQQKRTYERLKSYLNDRHNPKYHFFILDGMPDQNSEEMKQIRIATSYFSCNSYYWKDVFNKTTRGISLVVTRIELLSSNRKEWLNRAKDCVMRNYSSLYNSLKSVVGHDDIGYRNDSLIVIPFSIGEVFFKDLCIVDPYSAKEFANIMLNYVKESVCGSWVSKLWLFLKTRFQ